MRTARLDRFMHRLLRGHKTMTLTERVRMLFLDRPGEWIDGRTLAAVGGYAAWRTRVSDCRKNYGMRIENEVETKPNLKISRYRYVPATLFEVGGER